MIYKLRKLRKRLSRMSWSDDSDGEIAPLRTTAPDAFYDEPRPTAMELDDEPLILPEEAAADAKPKLARITRKFDIDLLMGDKEGLPHLARMTRSLPKFSTSSEERCQKNLSQLINMYQLWLHGIDSTISFDTAVQKVEKLTRERRAKIYLDELMREERRIKMGLDIELTREDGQEAMGGMAGAAAAAPGIDLTREEDIDDDDDDDLVIIPEQSTQDLAAEKEKADKAAKLRNTKNQALAKLAEKRRAMLAKMEDDYDEEEDQAPLF